MMAFLWEKSTSKQCLLDYILAVEKASGQSVLDPAYADLRVASSVGRNQWLQMQFTDAELSAERISTATARLQQAYIPGLMGESSVHTEQTTGSMSIAEAIEIVAASYAVEKSFKPPIKLGRYAYLDGPPRPDCVEVVVREVVDSLIYGKLSSTLLSAMHSMLYLLVMHGHGLQCCF
jgi:hypothetical protein